MSWYALENIDEAMEKSKEILFPFDLKTWTKLTIIALLAGGFSLPNMPSAPTAPQGESVYTPDAGSGDFTGPQSDMDLNMMTGMSTASMSGEIVLIAAIVLMIGLIFGYISGLFQFIYYQTILDEKPVIIENMRKHSGRALRYLGFQILFMIGMLATLAIPVAGLMAGPLVGILLIILVWIPLAAVMGGFSTLVHDVVLLRMIEAEEGLIQAWRSVWPDLKGEWREVVVYLVVKFFVGIGIGIGTFFLMITVLIVLIIPFGGLGLLAMAASPILAALIAAVGVLVFTVVMAYVRMPFSTYMFTFITLFYHDITS